MRQWISIRGPGGLRFGQSIGPEDFGPPKLPSWRRYELRKQLETAATAKGKTMTVADCDYVIDRTLEIATVDQNGLVLHLRGNRDKLINELSEILQLWDYPATPEEAARLVDKAIAKRSRPWFWLGAAIGAAIFLLAIITAK
jgi:hypothetical protein